MIYLDHAATSYTHPTVLDFLTKSLISDFANPSSSHKLGRALQSEIDEIKIHFISLLGGKNDSADFYFTSSATESNNTIIKGINFEVGDGVIYSKADHGSVVVPIEKLNSPGIKLFPIDFDNAGNLSDDSIVAIENVKLIVLTLINSQSGVKLNLAEICSNFRSRFPTAHIHIDAVQAFGKVPFSVNDNIDSVSITAHKIGGPKGIAGLYLKKKNYISPLILGGGQQNDFRSGTLPFSLIKAFFIAASIALKDLESNLDHIIKLSEALKDELLKLTPNLSYPFLNTSPYIHCILLKNIPSDVVLRHLEARNVFISTTSACSSKIKGYNPTLAALKIPEKYHKNILRISLSSATSESEVLEFVKEFTSVWNELKHLVK
jgi:cysteine desulfurase